MHKYRVVGTVESTTALASRFLFPLGTLGASWMGVLPMALVSGVS